VIAVTANDGAATKVHEFSGESSLGCLPDKMDITLTRSPAALSEPCLLSSARERFTRSTIRHGVERGRRCLIFRPRLRSRNKIPRFVP
jgi:hypothetical protein